MAFKSRDSGKFQSELRKFVDDPFLNLNFDGDSNVPLFRWYITRSEFNYIANSDIHEELFITKRLYLNNTIVIGKSLIYLNYNTYLCVIKEIFLYNDHHFNDNDYIIKFHGYSIQHCKCNLFYDRANYGNLFEYFQNNHNSSGYHLSNWENKIKLAWEISLGFKYLHNQKIVHLDIRSKNILLKYDEIEERLIPKISNFLWSGEIYSGKTSVYPIITLSSGEEVWKRWYDPDRLCDKKRFELSTSSDIYSLGLLFWEIVWCKPNNLPFSGVSIKNLYNHLLYNNYEELPELPEEYRDWDHLIKVMWKFKAEERCNIMTVELSMRKLFKGTNSEIQHNSN
ncbi:unnamed protein product [Rhizophagus irregularis]|nr:unnamed protein product [Rhizophagus irregularis]